MSASAPVLVTGVSGYLAGEIAFQLLQKSYKVRGTVRDLSNAQKVSHLKRDFPSIELHEADLVKEGSFDEAVKGCSFVFHIASPFIVSKVSDNWKEIIDPAVQGTLNVLRSVERAGCVQRVILTSSLAAVAGKRQQPHVFTEADWNESSTAEEEPYRYSKARAEKAAWEFAKEKGIDLVVINPSHVLGPPRSSRVDAVSVQTVKTLLDGSQQKSGTRGGATVGECDIRDVANAHIAAAETPSASGRYLITSATGVPHWEFVKILAAHTKFSKYPLPTHQNASITFTPQFDCSKIQRELGIQFTSMSSTIVDMADALVKFGIIPNIE